MRYHGLLSALLLFSAWARGEEDLFDIGLEQLGQVLVTGATLSPQNLQEVPTSVTVLSAAQIRELPVSTLEELLDFIPGFQSVRQGDLTASDTYALRGRRIGSANREVLVLVDGLRLHTAFTDGPAISRLDLGRIKQIEFIRGPGSALYGSNAFLGVINISTDYPQGELQLLAGDHLSQGLSVGNELRIGEYQLGFYARQYGSDGVPYAHAESYGQDVGSTSENTLDQDAAVRLQSGRLKAEITYAARYAQDGYLQENTANGLNRDTTRYTTAQLQYARTFSVLELSSRLYVRNWSRDNRMMTAPAGALAAVSAGHNEPLIMDVAFRSTEYGTAWLATYRRDTQLGFEFSQADSPVEASGNYDLLALMAGDLPIAYDAAGNLNATVLPRKVRQRFGFFWQQQIPLSDSLQLLSGLRYDRYGDIGEHFSPRMAAVYQAGETDSVKFSYGEAFRAPAQNELYISNNPVQLGNPDLQPETVQTYEAVWTHMLPTGISELSYFENRFVRGIEQFVTTNNVRSFQNADEEENNRGLEYSLQTALGSGFALRCSASHLLDMAQSAYRLAEQTGSMVLSWHDRVWQGSLSTVYMQDTEYLNRQQARSEIPSVWLWHAKVQYALATDAQIYLQLNNLFDRQYGSAPLGSVLDNSLPNPGFFALAGLRWHY